MSEDHDADNTTADTFNHQGPLEVPVSIGLWFFGILLEAWTGWLVCHFLRSSLFRRYLRRGITTKASILGYQNGEGMRVSRCVIEYEYTCAQQPPAEEDDEKEDKDGGTATDNGGANNHDIVVIRKDFLGLRVEEIERDLELAVIIRRPEIEENDDETGQQQFVEIVFLPGYPQSAYPKNRITEFFRQGEERFHGQGNLMFCALLALVGILLRESILLQFKKENWDSDYDVALLVWKILTMIGLYPVIFMVGTALSNGRILGSKQDKSESSYALVQNKDRVVRRWDGTEKSLMTQEVIT